LRLTIHVQDLAPEITTSIEGLVPITLYSSQWLSMVRIFWVYIELHGFDAFGWKYMEFGFS
jgi:hypothetical protein